MISFEDSNEQSFIIQMIKTSNSYDIDNSKKEFEDIQNKCSAIHLHAPNEIITIMRKNKIYCKNLDKVIEYLKENKKSENEILINQLCRIVKFSVQYGQNVEIKCLLDLLDLDEEYSKTEIVKAIGFQIDKNQKQIDDTIIKSLEEKLKENVDEEVKMNVQQKMRKKQNTRQKKQSQEYMNIFQKKQKSNQYLQKTRNQQQSIKSNYRTSKQQNIGVQGLKNAIESMNKNIQNTNLTPSFSNDKSKEGDDRTWYNGTYKDVNNIYNLAFSNCIVREDDKDMYLPSKFLNTSEKIFSNGILGYLVVDRMIAFIFQKISGRQKLNNSCFQKLTKSLNSLPEICKMIVGDLDKIKLHSLIKRKYFSIWIPREPNNNIEYQFLEKLKTIYSNYNCDLLQNKIIISDKEQKKKINSDLRQLILEEVNKIRLDAATALFNCIRKNISLLTENKQLIETIQKLQLDPNKEFNEKITLIAGTFLSSDAIDQSALFNGHLNNLIIDSNNSTSFDFVLKKSMNSININVFFNEENILKIQSIILNRELEIEKRISYQKIINKVLEHQESQGLTLKSLESCKKIIDQEIQNQERENLIETILACIFLTSEKQQHLSQTFIDYLLSKFNQFQEKFKYYTLIILGNVNNKFINQQNMQIFISLINCEKVVIANESTIQFEEPKGLNKQNFTSISSLICKMLLNNRSDETTLREQDISEILQVIERNDTQAKILASKIIFLSSNDSNIDIFNQYHLNKIKSYTDDDVYDVHVYMVLTFTSCIKKKLEQQIEIEDSLVNYMSLLYSFEEKLLQDEDYSNEINTQIIESFYLHSQKRGLFDQNSLDLLSSILFENSENIFYNKAIKIVSHYSKFERLSSNLVKALESLLDNDDQQIIFEIIENIIINKQFVSQKIQSKYIEDFFYLDDDPQNASIQHSNSILNVIEFQQGLTDENFEQLEIQKAINYINKNMHTNFNIAPILISIQNKTNQGVKIPTNLFKILDSNLQNRESKKIILNITENLQSIPQYLIDNLVNRFDSLLDEDLYIPIFHNLSKNNQKISSLNTKIKLMLENYCNFKHKLQIIYHLAQIGEITEESTLISLIKCYNNDQDIIHKQNLASIIFIVSSNMKSKIQKELVIQIKNILILQINEFNIPTMANECLIGIKFLQNYDEVDKQMTSALFKLVTNINISKELRMQIHQIIDSKQLSKEEQSVLQKLSNSNSFQEINLYQISEISKQKQLTNIHFSNLQKLIENDIDQNNDFYSSQKSLELLIDLEGKELIPDELIESVAKLLSSTTKQEIIDLCCELIVQISTKKTIHDRVVYTLLYLKKYEKVQSTLQIIKEKQSLPQNQQVTCILEHLPLTINKQDLQKVLQEVIAYLNDGFTINSSQVKQLIQVLQIQKQMLPKNMISSFTEIFSIILEQNKIEFIKYDELVKNQLLQSIRDNYISNNVVNGFRKLLKVSLKDFDVTSFMEEIFTYENYYTYDTYEQYQLLKIILVLFEEEKKILHVSNKCLNILENNLQDDNELIKNISFKILSAKKGAYFNVLNKFQNQMIQKYLIFLLDKDNFFDYSKLYTVCLLKNVKDAYIKEINRISKEQQLIKLLLNELFFSLKTDKKQRDQLEQTWEICSKKQSNYQQLQLLIHFIECQKEYQLDIKQIYQMLLVFRYFSFSHYVEYFRQNIPFESLLRRYAYCFIKQFIHKNLADENELMMTTNVLLKELDFDFIYQLFQKIDRIENISEIKSLIDFIKANKVRPVHLNKSKKSIEDMKKSIQIKLINLNLSEFEKKRNLKQLFYQLFDKGWSYQQLNQIIKPLNSAYQVDILNNQRKYYTIINIIHMINSFSIKSIEVETISKLFENKNIDQITLLFNQFCFDYTFSNVNENADIFTEFQNKNPGMNRDLIEIYAKYQKIKNQSFDLSIQKQYKKQISNFQENDIKKWCKAIRKNLELTKSDQFEVEAIQIIIRAYQIISNFQMKDSQILSCLVSLNKDKERGRLLQVATGEGKSLIICTLAIIYALKGHKVNIFTSSSVLAERDSKNNQKIFKMFELTCLHNNNDQSYIKGTRYCYKCDIVYGEISQFQFDTLRDEYKLLDTLGGRKCDIAIVDEVDSMLIDETSKIARLSSQIPGMDQFYIVYISIWHCLMKILSSLIHDENYYYIMKGSIEKNKEKLIFTYQEKGETKRIDDFEEFLMTNNNFESVKDFSDQIAISEIEIYIKEKLRENIEFQINNGQIIIPSHLEKFTARQIPKWVESSLIAYQYLENVNYIIDDGQIKPVDYFSTGQVLSSTNWSDGLHQFLQVKHNLKLTPETLTTNFLSNIGYLKRYKENIIGFTGTLGSEKAKEVMKLVYNVDFIYIPSIMVKKYYQYQPIFEKNEKVWVEQICLSAQVEKEKQRGVLIICESIHHATLIEKSLNAKIDSENIKLYVINNSYQEIQIEKIYKGQIFVATNLAGRGTDINTSEIEENGGLHVIVTFIPQNQRVEEQAFGRTARQGNYGTGQLIINIQSQDFKGINDFKQNFIKQRDEQESLELEDFLKNQLQTINLKDKIFYEFCKKLKQIRQNVKDQILKKKNFMKSWFDSYSFENQLYISAIEEIWAIFLHKIEAEKPNEKNCLNQFGIQAQKLLNNFEDLINSPYYYLQIANQLVIEEKYDESYEYYEKALKLKHNYNASAHIGQAIIQIEQQKQKEYKKLALNHFTEALTQLREEQQQLLTQQEILSDQDIESDLLKQIAQKIIIFGSYVNSIETCQQQIIKSQRYIEIERSEGNLKEYFFEKDQSFIIDGKDSSKQNIFVTFNNLIRYEDTGSKDQALQTLNCALKQKVDLKQNIQLNLKSISTKKLEFMLNPNLEINKCKKEDALEELNGKGLLKQNLVKDWLSKDNNQIQLKIYDDEQKEIEKCPTTSVKNTIQKLKDYNIQEHTFNILLQDANKIYNLIQQNKSKATLDIQIQNIEQRNEFKQFFNLTSQYLEIRLNGSIEKITYALTISNSLMVQVFTSDSQSEKMNVSSFKQRYLNRKNDCLSVILSFERKDKEYCVRIIDECQFKNIDITFFNIDLSSQIINLPAESINVSIKNLDDTISNDLINFFREDQIEFSLTFNNLSKDQANIIIKNASAQQEEIQISSKKTIFQQFSELEITSNQELFDLKHRGIEFFLQINEKGFVQWTTIGLLLGISLLQIGVGVAFFGFGGVGICNQIFQSQLLLFIIRGIAFQFIIKFLINQIAIISEGLSDLYNAYRIYRDRQFSWKSYAIQKAVSITISVATLGIGYAYGKISQKLAEKAAQKAAQNTVTKVATQTFQEVAEQKLTRIVCNPKKVIDFCKGLFSKKGSKVLVNKGAQLIAQKALSQSFDIIIEQSIKQIRPFIIKQTQQSFYHVFYSSKLINLICKMQAIDKINQKQELKQKIYKCMDYTLQRGCDQSIKQNAFPFIKSIYQSIGKEQHCNKISFVFAALQNAMGVWDCSQVAETFYNEMMTNLSKFDKEELLIEHLICLNCKIEEKKSKEICIRLKENNFILLDKEKSKKEQVTYHLEYINPKAFGIDEFKKFENNTILQRLPIQEIHMNEVEQKKKLEEILKSQFENDIDGQNKSEQVMKLIFKLNKEMYSMKSEELQHFIESAALKMSDQYTYNIENYFISPYRNIAEENMMKYLNNQLFQADDKELEQNNDNQENNKQISGEPDKNNNAINESQNTSYSKQQNEQSEKLKRSTSHDFDQYSHSYQSKNTVLRQISSMESLPIEQLQNTKPLIKQNKQNFSDLIKNIQGNDMNRNMADLKQIFNNRQSNRNTLQEGNFSQRNDYLFPSLFKPSNQNQYLSHQAIVDEILSLKPRGLQTSNDLDARAMNIQSQHLQKVGYNQNEINIFTENIQNLSEFNQQRQQNIVLNTQQTQENLTKVSNEQLITMIKNDNQDIKPSKMIEQNKLSKLILKDYKPILKEYIQILNNKQQNNEIQRLPVLVDNIQGVKVLIQENKFQFIQPSLNVGKYIDEMREQIMANELEVEEKQKKQLKMNSKIAQQQPYDFQILELAAKIYKQNYKIVYDQNYKATKEDEEKFSKDKQYLILCLKNNRKLYSNQDDNQMVDEYQLIHPALQKEKQERYSGLDVMCQILRNEKLLNSHSFIEDKNALQQELLEHILKNNKHLLEGYYQQNEKILNNTEVQQSNNTSIKGMQQVKQQCNNTIKQVRKQFKFGAANNNEYKQRNNMTRDEEFNNLPSEEQKKIKQQDLNRQKVALRRLQTQRKIINIIIKNFQDDNQKIKDEFKEYVFSNNELIKYISQVIKFQTGNCGECAYLAFVMLRYQCPNTIQIELRTEKVNKLTKQQGDHAFIAIKPYNVKDDSQTLIVDPWPANQAVNPQTIFAKDHFSIKQCEIDTKFQDFGIQQPQGDGNSWDNVYLLDPPVLQCQPQVDIQQIDLIYSIFEIPYTDFKIDNPS